MEKRDPICIGDGEEIEDRSDNKDGQRLRNWNVNELWNESRDVLGRVEYIQTSDKYINKYLG